jgi:hypothetical protein
LSPEHYPFTLQSPPGIALAGVHANWVEIFDCLTVEKVGDRVAAALDLLDQSLDADIVSALELVDVSKVDQGAGCVTTATHVHDQVGSAGKRVDVGPPIGHQVEGFGQRVWSVVFEFRQHEKSAHF